MKMAQYQATYPTPQQFNHHPEPNAVYAAAPINNHQIPINNPTEALHQQFMGLSLENRPNSFPQPSCSMPANFSHNIHQPNGMVPVRPDAHFMGNPQFMQLVTPSSSGPRMSVRAQEPNARFPRASVGMGGAPRNTNGPRTPRPNFRKQSPRLPVHLPLSVDTSYAPGPPLHGAQAQQVTVMYPHPQQSFNGLPPRMSFQPRPVLVPIRPGVQLPPGPQMQPYFMPPNCYQIVGPQTPGGPNVVMMMPPPSPHPAPITPHPTPPPCNETTAAPAYPVPVNRQFLPVGPAQFQATPRFVQVPHAPAAFNNNNAFYPGNVQMIGGERCVRLMANPCPVAPAIM